MQQLLQANQPINQNRQNEGELRWLDEPAGTLHLNPNHANPRTAVRVVTKSFQDSEFFIDPQGHPVPQLENTMAPQFLQFVQATAQTRFKLKIIWNLVLYNNETDEEINFYDRRPISPWFDNMTQASLWIQQLEEERLQGHMQLPNTKFSYERTQSIEVNILLSRQPLHYGIGKLPEWLRNKRGLHSLDQYDDFLCLARCLAVHFGFNPKRCQREAKRYATQFEEATGKPICFASFEELETFFKVGIAAYTVDDTRLFTLFHQPEADYPTNMTMGCTKIMPSSSRTLTKWQNCLYAQSVAQRKPHLPI